jgi:hypothetical protein
MALVREFHRGQIARNSRHEEIEATYHIFERDGRKLLQIDTFGRKSRAMPSGNPSGSPKN